MGYESKDYDTTKWWSRDFYLVSVTDQPLCFIEIAIHIGQNIFKHLNHWIFLSTQSIERSLDKKIGHVDFSTDH